MIVLRQPIRIARWISLVAIAATVASPCQAQELGAAPGAGRLARAAAIAERSEAPAPAAAPATSAELNLADPSTHGYLAAPAQSFAALDAAAKFESVGFDSRQLDSAEFHADLQVHTPLAQRRMDNLDLLPGEPAHEILQLIERAGGSVLEGTLFNVPGSNESFYADREARRATIVKTVRQLQAEEEQEQLPTRPVWSAHRDEVSAAPAADSTPAYLPRPGQSPIAELRSASDQLEQAASALERQELYDYADRIRQTAAEMRLEARRLSQRGAHAEPAAAAEDVFPASWDSAREPLSPDDAFEPWPPAARHRSLWQEPQPSDSRDSDLREEVEALRDMLKARPAASPISAPARYLLEPREEYFRSSSRPSEYSPAFAFPPAER